MSIREKNMNIKSFFKYLASDESAAMDESPKGGLSAHDKRFHGGNYDGKGKCEFREKMSKGDEEDVISSESDRSARESASQQDYDDLADSRDRLERVARLLNGRTGNLQALQASKRWNDLDGLPQDAKFLQRLDDLSKSSDPAIAKAGADLKQIADNIVNSKKNGWNDPAGMVPPASAMPQATFGSSSQNPQQAGSSSSSGGSFSDDDAKALLFRAAKSINHHIDKGDNTPNAGAIQRLKAAKADIAGLKDPALDKLFAEFEASEKSGFTQKISKVPAPSQAWQQAHAPQQPSWASILQAMLGGGIPAGMGVRVGNGGNGGQPQAPVKGKFSGQTWKPFSQASAWDADISKINANHPAITDGNYFKNKADALTPQQAIADMEARGDIVKGGYRDSFDNNDPDEYELWDGWRPSKKLSDDTARCVSVCFDDLRKRFPNMPWKNNLEIRCGTKPMTGGQSTHTKDWRRHTVLFNCDYGNIWGGVGLGKSNYGHNDARFPFDVLRHEMGHALISGQLPNGKRMISKWHDAMTAAYGNPAKDLEAFAGRYVSSYAVTRKTGGFSMAECLSECFSLATSPDYKAGYLPPPVEDFIFGEMLGMKKSGNP